MGDSKHGHCIHHGDLTNCLTKIQTDIAVIKNDTTYIKKDVTETKQAVNFQNGRIRKLESWRQRWIGAAKVGGAITVAIGLGLAALKVFA